MCSQDSNCPGAQVCYVNVTWSKQSFCGCSFYYGGTGLDCSELNVQSYLLVLIALITILLSILPIVYTLTSCGKNSNFRHVVYSRDNSIATWLMAIAGLLSNLIGMSFRLYSFLEPETNNVVPATQSNGEKVGPFSLVEWVLFPVAQFCAITASMNISLMWIDVATRTAKLSLSEVGVMRRYRNGVRLVQGWWLGIGIIGLTTGLAYLLAIVGGVSCLGIAITYFVGRRQFTSVLSQKSSNKSLNDTTNIQDGAESQGVKLSGLSSGFKTDLYNAMIVRIRNTSSAVILLTLSLFSWTVAISVLSSRWKDYGFIDGLGAYSIVFTTLYIPLSLLLTVILLYAHTTIARRAQVPEKSQTPPRPRRKTGPMSNAQSNAQPTRHDSSGNSVEEFL